MTQHSDHLSVDQLADLDAEVLADDDAMRARAHLGGCAQCRGTHELIAGLPALLASPPPPAPADVTARVVAAIEREQIARVAAADEARASEPAGARAVHALERRRWSVRLGAGLLGTAAVLGGGYVLATGLSGGGDDGLQDADMGTAESAPMAEGDVAAGDTSGGTEEFGTASAGQDYSAASLDTDVAALLESAPTGGRTDPGQSTVLGDDGEVGEPDDVAAKVCAQAAQRRADNSATPLAVDIATYEGQPAVVVVLPIPGTTADSVVDVWVLDASCVNAPVSDLVDEEYGSDVLARESVRR